MNTDNASLLILLSTDNKPPTIVEGTLDLIYARDVSIGLDITNTHVVTLHTGPVIILRCFK